MKLPAAIVGYACMLALSARAADTVLFLHGLGRTQLSMARLAAAARAEGYEAINRTYPSRSWPLERLATEWLPAQLGPRTEGARLHIVTHSMGGILVRLWLRECGVPADLGHVVMLAPPNDGSPLPDRLEAWAAFRWSTGVNGRRLGTGADSLPRALGGWPTEAGPLGIIAGDRSLNPLLGSLLPRPHDGKVPVAATHLAGEADHLVLPQTHTWMPWRRETSAQVLAFLRTGAFAR